MSERALFPAIASPPFASQRPWRVALAAKGNRSDPGFIERLRGWVGDALLLLLLAFAFPVAILIVGTPIALFVRLVLEVARALIGAR